jgi:hypothetical protein
LTILYGATSQFKSYAGSLPNGTCTGCGNSFFSDATKAAHGAMARAMAVPFARAVAGRTLSAVVRAAAANATAAAAAAATTAAAAAAAAAGSGSFVLTYALPGDGVERTTEVAVPGLWAAPAAFEVAVGGDAAAAVAVEPGGAARAIAAGVRAEAWALVRVTHNKKRLDKKPSAAATAATTVTVTITKAN